MKIGLIAMSGLQVYDPKLKELGLTLPGLLERGRAIASLPSLALLTLAAMTPKGHEVEYLEVPDITQLHNVPDHYDLVAISSYSAQIHEAYQLAQIYKGKGIKTIIGGPHVTCVPDEAAQQCNTVAIGEGEIFGAT
jgi:B12 binding domain.